MVGISVGLGSLVGVVVGVMMGLGFWVMLGLASPSNCPEMFSSEA